ncbi:MAG TPA: class I SAM-dependent methyltransferase [Streptosporangiaceae bacterium]|jgi:SAM-dependent methyltransferase|nr:class I SAM-dependent methyltransferase [Streptosporangiaceae bacterium]
MAESFGTDAERYDRTRPGYPAALVDRIVATSPGPDLVDVGCGTGIVARQFQAAGCRVLGVDPDERMAGLARRGGIAVEVARFEDWDPAGRSFDAVIAGQAWHWVDMAAGAAKAAQALRPGGRVALFWNSFLPPPGLFEQAQSRMPGPEDYSLLCGKAAGAMRATAAFGEPEQWRFDWERHYTRDEWLDQIPTFGTLTRLSPGELRPILGAAGAAIDAVGGSFTMGYATVVATAQRT